VAVDFSAPSAAALAWAAHAAVVCSEPLTILHVVHDPAAAPGSYRAKKHDKHLRRLEEAAAEMLDDFVATMTAENGDLRALSDARRMLVVGIPVARILEVAENEGARLLVLGSNGRTGLSRLLLGSNALRVAQLSPIPVTIVKGTEG
jgi:nucleotide-binding universal stress UspA family protein